LRVHLQWLGFPIDGDVSYGGRSLDSDYSVVAVERMREEITAEDSRDLSLDSISSDDVVAARAACPCCKGGEEGIVSSFTKEQLLKDSEIRLHALRYGIPFSRRKRKTTEESGEPHSFLSLEVGLPSWASDLGRSDIMWLQNEDPLTTVQSS